MTYAPAKFEVTMSNHLQENTLFGLDLGPWSHEMLPKTLNIMLPMQLQFEAAMSNDLGDTFTRKYIGSLTLTLGHTKCCPVPSTSCHLFRYNVKVGASNGLGGNTFTRNVTDGRAHTWTDRQTGHRRYEINILVFLKKKSVYNN